MASPVARRRAGLLAPALGLAVAAGAATAGPAAAAPRVTVFGDSVQASFGFAPQAPRVLRPGIDLRVEAAVCRRLTGPGCLGGRPPSVLALAEALGPRLGDLVVVHVGYNDSAGAYDVPRVLRAFSRSGVRAVVWVTLRERHGGYARTNARIRDAARRFSGRRGYPVVRIADWNAASAGRPWFSSDGIHLNGTGAVGLAGVLRTAVVRTFAELDVRIGGSVVRLPVRSVALPSRVRALAPDRGAVWAVGGSRLTRLTGAGARGSRPAGTGAVVSDGRRAWRLPGSGGVARTLTGGLRVDTGTPATAVATAGPVTWFLVPCAGACASPAALVGVGGGDRRAQPVTTPATALAGSPTGLWVVRDAGGRQALELRGPRSGRLVRTVTLRPGVRVRDLVATDRGAFVVAADGRLLRVGRSGRVRLVGRGAAAVAGDGRGEVWALQAVRGRVVRLDPDTGTVLARAAVGRRPLRVAAPLALAGRTVWVGGPGRGLRLVATR